MKKLIPFIVAILALLTISNNYQEDYYIIPEESIRIRIIPNSNSVKDQYLKKQVKTNLEIELQKDLQNAKTIEMSRSLIKSNINKYKKEVKQVLKNEKSDLSYSVDYGYHYFPEKIYKGVKYESGEYESLLVTLGEAKGDNWWCVLFPPICSLEENNSSNNEIEYSFYVKEMFNKYLK